MSVLKDGSDEVLAEDLRWRLSQINPNRPLPVRTVPEDIRAMSLLAHDVTELEALVAEWERIAASYRELAQVALDAIAQQDTQIRRLTARVRDLMEVTRPRA